MTRIQCVGTEPRSSQPLQRGFLIFFVSFVSFVVPFVVLAQNGERRPYTSWSEYGGSADSMQFSALADINRSNVQQLQRAWFFPVAGDADRMPFNPLVIDDVM